MTNNEAKAALLEECPAVYAGITYQKITALSLLGKAPKKGLTVEIGDDLYEITKVHPEAGEIVLYLEMLTE